MLHEACFFELAGTLTVEVEFIVTQEEARKLLDLLHREKGRLFYAYTPALLGVINPDTADPPSVGECFDSSKSVACQQPRQRV